MDLNCNKKDNNDDELQYLNLVKKIISEGNERPDNTGEITISTFGPQMRFNLRDNKIPLLTTKRLAWRAVAEELFWFISGSTDSKLLQQKKVYIWEGTGSRQVLDASGFTEREEGDLGPIYGFQWRHCGAKYKTCKDDYSGQGIDQLFNVIEKLKIRPHDRGILLCSWNVVDLKQMALSPCHCLVQFYVHNGELSCQLYQRSAEMSIGVPFNIATYSMLTHMIAHVTNLKPGDFIHTIGDAHIYLNHVESLLAQCERIPVDFPTLTFNRKITNIEEFCIDDFNVENYQPAKKI